MKKQRAKAESVYRTPAEQNVGKKLEGIFHRCPDSVETRLENFTKYVREQKLRQLFALYEIFKKVVPVKGSIVECGVYRGFSLMAFAMMSSIFDPINLTRRIYAFDTFAGFPSVKSKDASAHGRFARGTLSSNSEDELNEILNVYDSNRFLGHIPKVRLIKGDAVKTIPKFMKENPHLVVSLLFLDFDLYEPTRAAIEHFAPRMPKGSVIAFDELDNPLWPGETLALLETLGVNGLKIQRLEFDPYIGFAVVDSNLRIKTRRKK